MSSILKSKLGDELVKEKETHRLCGGQVHTTVFKTDNQQGPTVSDMELLKVMWQPEWEGRLGRMDAWTCVAEPFHCSPEIITTLLISYIPI